MAEENAKPPATNEELDLMFAMSMALEDDEVVDSSYLDELFQQSVVINRSLDECTNNIVNTTAPETKRPAKCEDNNLPLKRHLRSSTQDPEFLDTQDTKAAKNSAASSNEYKLNEDCGIEKQISNDPSVAASDDSSGAGSFEYILKEEIPHEDIQNCDSLQEIEQIVSAMMDRNEHRTKRQRWRAAILKSRELKRKERYAESEQVEEEEQQEFTIVFPKVKEDDTDGFVFVSEDMYEECGKEKPQKNVRFKIRKLSTEHEPIRSSDSSSSVPLPSLEQPVALEMPLTSDVISIANDVSGSQDNTAKNNTPSTSQRKMGRRSSPGDSTSSKRTTSIRDVQWPHLYLEALRTSEKLGFDIDNYPNPILKAFFDDPKDAKKRKSAMSYIDNCNSHEDLNYVLQKSSPFRDRHVVMRGAVCKRGRVLMGFRHDYKLFRLLTQAKESEKYDAKYRLKRFPSMNSIAVRIEKELQRIQIAMNNDGKRRRTQNSFDYPPKKPYKSSSSRVELERLKKQATRVDWENRRVGRDNEERPAIGEYNYFKNPILDDYFEDPHDIQMKALALAYVENSNSKSELAQIICYESRTKPIGGWSIVDSAIERRNTLCPNDLIPLRSLKSNASNKENEYQKRYQWQSLGYIEKCESIVELQEIIDYARARPPSDYWTESRIAASKRRDTLLGYH